MQLEDSLVASVRSYHNHRGMGKLIAGLAGSRPPLAFIFIITLYGTVWLLGLVCEWSRSVQAHPI
jgi:hypothetical protein